MATTTLPETGIIEEKNNGTKSGTTKYLYSFGGGKADGNGKMKDVLGGKGAGLAEMTNAGLPVPPGFTIQTEACREYMRMGAVSKAVDQQMQEALAKLETLQGQKLGKGCLLYTSIPNYATTFPPTRSLPRIIVSILIERWARFRMLVCAAAAVFRLGAATLRTCLLYTSDA